MKRSIYDVAIIGAGVIGAALAHQLGRYRLRVVLFEAGDDVAFGATRANSGIVHGGYDAKAGSRKARFCLPGNRLFDTLARELDFPFRRCGSVVLAFSDEDRATLERIKANGAANGVDDLEIADRAETLRRIPRLNPAEVAGGLFCPGAGIVSPYEYAIALVENAVANGVEVRIGAAVTDLDGCGDTIRLLAGDKEYAARFVVNAAGAGSADIARLAGPAPFAIRPRKGQYIVFRRGSAEGLNTVVFQTPSAKGKGILVTPTTWNNLMIGPDAAETDDPHDLGTDPESLARIARTAARSVCDFDLKMAIRVYSGIRAASDRGDFVIEWSQHLPGLLHLAGIESPGLTASPAIAVESVRLLGEAGLTLVPDPAFQPRRKAPVHPGPLGSPAAAAKATRLPPGDPDRVICRCEQVREATVVDALSRGIPIRSLDAVKRRTRAGMGPCQGSFCGPRVRELVARTVGIAEDEVAAPTRERANVRAELDAVRDLLSGVSS